jgi:DNA-binding NarL/FixJ family response regulator
MRRSVIIIQDDRKLREELEYVVNSEADMYCLGSHASVGDALLQIGKDKPNVILMNIKLPGVSGIVCLYFSKAFAPTVQTVMATACCDAECIVQALAAKINGGTTEYNFPEQATSEVGGGDAPTKASTVRTLLQRCRDLDVLSNGMKGMKDLSPREQQVLDLLATGLIYRKIAIKLNIGEETVRSYVKQICQKLHVRNRTEAIANYWQASKIVPLTTEVLSIQKCPDF